MAQAKFTAPEKSAGSVIKEKDKDAEEKEGKVHSLDCTVLHRIDHGVRSRSDRLHRRVRDIRWAIERIVCTSEEHCVNMFQLSSSVCVCHLSKNCS